MPYTKSKYSKETTQLLTMDAFDVLVESPVALTISEICVQRMTLMGQTSQKMARCLNTLVEQGLVEKVKSKSGRMLYMARARLEEQEYREIGELKE